MVSRKSHPKSRNGCAQCKRRRIKCDEVGPTCSNCQKHEIECDFATNPPKSNGSPESKRRRSNDTKSTLHSPAGVSPTVHDAIEEGYSTGSGRELPRLQLEELKLLHHFTTETFVTLSDRPESHEIWRVTVPQIAFEHEFLMRGILAIAALHLGSLQTTMQDHYTKIAIRQQDSALKGFRAIMAEPEKGNCDAFFAMSSLIVVYGFESPKVSDSLGMFTYKGDHSDEWLPLIRGVNSIIMSVWQDIKKGRLSGLLHDHTQSPGCASLDPVLKDQLDIVERFCENGCTSETDIAACKEAINQLRWCFLRMQNKTRQECEVSLAFLWPVMIPEHFIILLNRRNSVALVILAHYCINLKHLDCYWWMNGWANHIVENIFQELEVGKQPWVAWPIDMVSQDCTSPNMHTNPSLPIGFDGRHDINEALDKQPSAKEGESGSTSGGGTNGDTRRSS